MDNIVVNVYLEGDADGVFNLVKTEAKNIRTEQAIQHLHKDRKR